MGTRTNAKFKTPDGLQSLLTAEDVAIILRISVRTVRRMIASGKLPAIAIGRSIRIDPRSVSALIERK